MKNWFRGTIAHPTEAALAWALNAFFAMLPVDGASALGGWMGRMIGPKLRVSNNARRSLARVFPELSAPEIENIVLRMWDNLGRTAGEHPHLARFDPYRKDSRVEVVGLEHLELLNDGAPALFFGGHIANWEISPLAGTKRGLTIHLVYRRANNPFFDRLVQKGREAMGGKLFPKGAEGSKDILRALKKGEHLAMLVDQKMNDGISVPFLGQHAMTAPALGQLAYRYNCHVLPVQVERLGGANFQLTLHPPLELPDSGDKQKDIETLMVTVNEQLGEWIKQRPEQWLWVHNRWPNEQEHLPK
ncbi:MAG: lauroyl acyltransferase [Rhodospirillaceae bacterium]|nr:lauroyl acyltransferase [Rhodospirillaceae bacterium]